ncbi:hypothetical protein HMI54_014622 [Coelomomyces lativittatus]|nr:hypothetical protein HMI56_006543 [Coelomomyces lativittatus]KAJ1513893.1 hypothetical protein HMI54_014622 [Coelomomyces lativittatus]KAJ1517341.1 hypothetical protein HMI55_007397 [Coelomomyces lativittatus]
MITQSSTLVSQSLRSLPSLTCLTLVSRCSQPCRFQSNTSQLNPSSSSSTTSTSSFSDDDRNFREKNLHSHKKKYQQTLKQLRLSFSQRYGKSNSKSSKSKNSSTSQFNTSEETLTLTSSSSPDISKTPKNGNPMKVGTLLSRRALKRMMVFQHGEIDPTPLHASQVHLSKYERIPPPVRIMASDPESLISEQLRKELRSTHTRLHHLLHLFHETEDFITKSNLESHLDSFFKQRTAFEFDDSIESKLKCFESNLAKEPTSPESLWATQEVDTQVPGGIKIESGSPYDHAFIRETVFKDHLSGSLFGKPGVEKILEWSNNEAQNNVSVNET